MKINHIILLFTLLFVSSCHQRQDLGYVPSQESEVALTFTGSFADFSLASTRSYPADPVEIRKNRINFQGLRIVLYSVSATDPNQAEQVAYAYDLDINAVKGVFSGSDLQPSEGADSFTFTTKGKVKVDPQDYLVYLFTSPTKSLKQATKVGQPFTALSAPMTYD